MAVKIRLARKGRKRRPIYSVVVADSRAPRDGRYIEKLGNYNPNVHPPEITLDVDRAFYWLMTGAQPTDTTRYLLSQKGVMLKKHLQVGVNKGAITQEVADQRFNDWLGSKDAKAAVEIEAKEKAAADARAKAEAEEKAKVEAAEAEAKAQAAAEAKAKEEAEAEAKNAEENTEEAAPETTTEETPAAE